MTKTVEVSAKRLDDAIAEACRQLGVNKDDATIEILSQGGIFSKAKVRVSVEGSEAPKAATPAPKPEPKKDEKPAKKAEKPPEKKAEKPPEKKAEKIPAKKAEKAVQKEDKKADKAEHKADKQKKPEKPVQKPRATDRPERREREDRPVRDDLKPIEGDGGANEFLQGVFDRMGVESKVEIKTEDDRMTIDLKAKDAALIGQRGETLSALRYLTSLVVNKGDSQFMYIDMDSQDYRARRKETLEKLAVKTADRAVRSGRKVKLEPMPSGDRRIIHSILQDREDVICRSEGREPRRAIAVLPK